MDKVIVAAVTALVMMAGFLMYLREEKMRRNMKNLHERVKTLEEENIKLKSANRTHLPYNTAEEIEHLMAAVIVLKNDLSIKTTLVENIEAHARLARENKRAGADS